MSVKIRIVFVGVLGLLSCISLFSCSSEQAQTRTSPGPAQAPAAPEPPKPRSFAFVSTPLVFQDRAEPIRVRETFEFELPERPRRARLVLRYVGVPGALSEDYTMGRFRDRVELNGSFLLDLNTHSEAEDRPVEYTQWISRGMFRRHNTLTFQAGDNGDSANLVRDSFELRQATLELDW